MLITAFYLIYITYTLPDIRALENYRPSQITKVYDCKGRLLTEFFSQRRQYITIDKIPEHVKNAFIAVEDKSFYKNIGIDFAAILRALINDIKAGKIVEGGSTISQQLVKNLLLTPERKIDRKIKEIFLAVKLNKIYPKNKILEMYLNQIYLGHGAYGVQAAAQTYFGKNIWDLTICEAAVLAGLPKAPSYYDPYKNLVGATERRDLVIQRMLEEGYVDENTAVMCKSEVINLKYTDTEEKIKDYATLAIRNWFVNKFGYKALYEGGYKIYTTIDKDLQMNASEIVKDKLSYLQKKFNVQKLNDDEISFMLEEYKKQNYLMKLKNGNIYIGLISGYENGKYKVLIRGFEGYFKYKKQRAFKNGTPVYIRYIGGNRFEFVPYLEASLIAIDNKTGQIRVIIGGYDINKSKFNRALQSKRQPGSAFKPIIYLDAILNGYTQISVLKDEPISFWDPDRFEEWIPENYDGEFHGDISLRYSLVHSLNVASVYLYDRLNPEDIIKLAYKIGIRTHLKPVKSLVLGSIDISPLELASVYSTFANNGVHCKPYIIEKIENSEGKIIYRRQPICKQIIPPDANAVLVDILKGVIKEGTGKAAKVLGIPVAGKTGTTDNYTDAWFAGFSTYYTTVVWTGYDFKKKIGWGATGARAALPIWIDFMAAAHTSFEEIKDFELPENTAYYPIDEKSFSLSNGMCNNKEMLFIIGTEPDYDCFGNFTFYMPQRFLTFLDMKLPNLKNKIGEIPIINPDKTENYIENTYKEKEGKILDNSDNEDFIFDIKGDI